MSCASPPVLYKILTFHVPMLVTDFAGKSYELLHIGVRRSIIVPIDVVPLFPLVGPLSTFVGNVLSFLHCFCCSKFCTRVGRKPTAEPSFFTLAWDRRRFCT